MAYVNRASTTYSALRAQKIGSLAAKGIIAHRDGPDGIAGTSDDDLYDGELGGLRELDRVKWVGLTVMRRLGMAVAKECLGGSAEVIFSPQPYAASHLARLVQLIDGAKVSLDIAMYNLSDSGVQQALGRAVGRHVKVRFLSEDAGADVKSPAGTKSAALEGLGVNVRYVTKIMHHKVMIVDGPRADLKAAETAKLVTGSANWSGGGATRYDENTLFLSGVPRLALLYQAEYNFLWAHSKDFVWNAQLPYEQGLTLDSATFPAGAGADAVFTSANFTAADGSTSFRRVVGANTVADALVKEIAAAKTSIHVASGHLRSRLVADALLAAKKARPGLDIRVYLDGQEYISAAGHGQQESRLKACLQNAGTDPSKVEDCQDTGFLFSYQLSQAGIELRYKYYAYRWDFSYAKQMHNKYFVFDGQTLITGSYNLSDNAEHNTFENMAILRAPAYASLIAKYQASFQGLWSTGGSLLAGLKTQIATGPVIPLVFEPMALTWQQVTELKQLIVQNCPAVNSDPYRQGAASHTTCPR